MCQGDVKMVSDHRSPSPLILANCVHSVRWLRCSPDFVWIFSGWMRRTDFLMCLSWHCRAAFLEDYQVVVVKPRRFGCLKLMNAVIRHKPWFRRGLPKDQRVEDAKAKNRTLKKYLGASQIVHAGSNVPALAQLGFDSA